MIQLILKRKKKSFWDIVSTKAKFKSDINTKTAIQKSLKYFTNEDNVLDFACGNGIVSFLIADKVKQIIAIDTSDKMIKYAKESALELNINNVDFYKIEISENILNNYKFDVILAFNILQYINDLDSLFKRINQLLSENGIFISSTACLGNRKSFLSRLVSFVSKLGVIPNFNFLKNTELESKIKECGFELVESVQILDSDEYLIVMKKSTNI